MVAAKSLKETGNMEHFTINLANRLRQRASNVLARNLAPDRSDAPAVLRALRP